MLRTSTHDLGPYDLPPLTKAPCSRHQVQDANFGDLFALAIPAPEPEPEPETGSSESPVEPPSEPTPVSLPAKRTSPNTSAKRRRLNPEGPVAPTQPQAQPLSTQLSSANRSSRRALRAPVHPDPYDLENAPSTVHEDGPEEEANEEEEEDDEARERTPQSRAKRAPGSARSAASKSAAQTHAPPQSSPLRSLRGEEVTESPADEPGSGHRRRVRANGVVTSSALLQSALRSVDNDTGNAYMQSSSPLSRKSRKSTAGTAASARSHRTGLRRSTRLSGSPDDEVNELSSDPPIVLQQLDEAHDSRKDPSQEGDATEVAETVVEESTVVPDEEAEKAQEVNDKDAALRLGKQRQRRPEPAVSPELSPDSPDEPVAKRPRKAPVAKRNSPAKQRQPKAPRVKSNKPTVARKKKDGNMAGAVVIKIQRFTRPRSRADDGSGDEDPLNSTIPYASRSGVNAVDVFAQMCEEIMGKMVENLMEGIRNAEDAAAKKELRVKLVALQAFREEVRTRLLEHVSRLSLLRMMI